MKNNQPLYNKIKNYYYLNINNKELLWIFRYFRYYIFYTFFPLLFPTSIISSHKRKDFSTCDSNVFVLPVPYKANFRYFFKDYLIISTFRSIKIHKSVNFHSIKIKQLFSSSILYIFLFDLNTIMLLIYLLLYYELCTPQPLFLRFKNVNFLLSPFSLQDKSHHPTKKFNKMCLLHFPPFPAYLHYELYWIHVMGQGEGGKAGASSVTGRGGILGCL